MSEKTYPELYDHLRGLMGKLAKESPGPIGALQPAPPQMGGGPAAVYAAMAMEALDQFQQSGVSAAPPASPRS